MNTGADWLATVNEVGKPSHASYVNKLRHDVITIGHYLRGGPFPVHVNT